MRSRGVLTPVRRFDPITALCFFLLLMSPALAIFQITNDFTSQSPLMVGESFRVEWEGASEPVTLRVMNGSEGNLNLVGRIESGLLNGYYDWIPTTPGRNFTIEIRDQSHRPPNYSGRFDVRRSDGSLPPFPDPPTSTISTSAEPTATQTDSQPPSRTSNPPPNPTAPISTAVAEAVSGFEALPTGAKAGIGAGAGASAILLLFIICYFFYRRGKSAGLKVSAEAFRAASASGAFGVGGGRGGGNPEDAEFGRPVMGSTSGRGVYSPAPDSDLGMPPVILGGEGISGSGFASSDNKSVPTLVSSVPDPPAPVHAGGDVATTAGRTGMTVTQIASTNEFGRDSPAAGAGAATGGEDDVVTGGGTLNTNSNVSGSTGLNNVAPPYTHPPTPGPGVYEMPTSPGMVPGTAHMMPQGHGTVPVQVPLVNSQPYVVYGAPGIGQTMRMVMQPYYFNEGYSTGRMSPGGDFREGRR